MKHITHLALKATGRAGLLAALALAVPLASAQTFPNKPIRLVVQCL